MTKQLISHQATLDIWKKRHNSNLGRVTGVNRYGGSGYVFEGLPEVVFIAEDEGIFGHNDDGSWEILSWDGLVNEVWQWHLYRSVGDDDSRKSPPKHWIPEFKRLGLM